MSCGQRLCRTDTKQLQHFVSILEKLFRSNPDISVFKYLSIEEMTYFHHHYHHSSSLTRTCCNMIFFVLSLAAIAMLVLGILCLAANNGVGYCTHMSLGGFIGLLSSGIALAVFCVLFLFCVGCCVDSAERVALLN